jgi:hypothetical protein
VPPSAASTIKSDWLVVFNSAHPAITANKKPIYVATAAVPNYLFKIFDKVGDSTRVERGLYCLQEKHSPAEIASSAAAPTVKAIEIRTGDTNGEAETGRGPSEKLIQMPTLESTARARSDFRR